MNGEFRIIVGSSNEPLAKEISEYLNHKLTPLKK